MSKQRHRQQQVTRRYIERTVTRARDEIIRAVLWATAPDNMLSSASASERTIGASYSPSAAGPTERPPAARSLRELRD